MYNYSETAHTFELKDDGLAVALATAPLKKPKKKPKKYTPVTQKVHSVAVTMPDEFRIIHQFPSDPLEDLIPLNPNPPVFMPGKRIIFEQLELMNLNPDGFLWPEEEKLAADVSVITRWCLPGMNRRKGSSGRTISSPSNSPS